MKQIKQSFLYAILAIALFATSCSKDESPVLKSGKYTKGVFVVNEGQFKKGDGSITFYNPETKTAEADIFKAVNGEPLGDIVQSILFSGNKAYIAVNNSHKFVVVDRHTFKKEAVVEIKQPRYVISVSDTKLYVSSWENNSIAVINTKTNTKEKDITLKGAGPEVMLKKGNYVYVALVGGFGKDNKVAVIDINKDEVVTTVTVGDAPLGLQEGSDGNIWVLCRGYYGDWQTGVGQTQGSIGIINPTTNEFKEMYKLPAGIHPDPNRFVADKEKKAFYYINGSMGFGAIYKFDITTKTAAEFIKGNFYGLGYDAKNNLIYGNENIKDKTCKTHCYDLTGKEKYSFDAGYYANSVIFTE